MKDLYVFLSGVREKKVKQLKEPVHIDDLWKYVSKDPKFKFKDRKQFDKIIYKLERKSKVITENNKIFVM